jgi:poly(3-hydroxybutyrate) depolymerase
MQRVLILLLFCVSLFAGVAGACDFTKRGTSQTCTVTVNGVTRQYLLYIPKTLPAAPSLLLYLHGAHGGMYEGQNLGWTTKASQMNFISAYPQALPNNAGITSWNLYFNNSFTNPPDDVAFIKLLIQTVELGLAVDSHKVFVTGFSLGGFMTNRVGVELGGLVAAIAPVSGELWESTGGTVPNEAAPVSVLMLNGSADTSVPYCGMTSPYPEATEDDTFNYWQTQNVCKQNTAALCSGGKPTTTSSKTASGCSSSVVVQQYELIGGIHKWYTVPMNVAPGTSTQPYNSKFTTTTGLTTNDIIWNFFVAHPKP